MIKGIINLITKTKLFSPIGIFVIVQSVLRLGVNLFTLLSISSKLYPKKVALCNDNKTYTYNDLFAISHNVRLAFELKYKLEKGRKIGFFCANNPAFLFSLFASSGIGLDIYLFNSILSDKEFNKIVETYQLDFIIYDNNLDDCIQKFGLKSKSLNTSFINKELYKYKGQNYKLKSSSFNKLVMLTSGTTGISVTCNSFDLI